MPSSKTIRLGIIGGGYWSDFVHFPAIQHCRKSPPAGLTIEIAGIWNLDPKVAERYARTEDFGTAYPSLERMLEDERIDAFVVVIAPGALAGVVRKLIPTGKPIFTEKPPGSSTEEAEELAKTVRSINLVAFNRRYIPLNLEFKKLLEQMGQGPLLVDCEFYRHNRLEPQFLRDTGIHIINYLEFLFGEIEEARTHCVVKDDSQAIHLVRLKWRHGPEGQVRFIQNTGVAHERVHVHGAGCSLSLHAPLQGSTDYPGRIIRCAGGKVSELGHGKAEAPLYVNLGVLAEHEEFLRAVAFGDAVRSTFKTSVNSMRISERLGDATQKPPAAASSHSSNS